MTGCGAHVVDGENNFGNVDNGYITLEQILEEDGCVIAYDKNTKVMYMCVYGVECHINIVKNLQINIC